MESISTSSPTIKVGSCEPNLFLEAALSYAARGWTIIPIVYGTKVPPKGFEWQELQTKPPSRKQLEAWFSRTDLGGLACLHGSASGGLVCRDYDIAESYDAWSREHPDLASQLPTVRTGRGYHVYFIGPERYEGKDKLGDGEYIGNSKHYSILPPSLHEETGEPYTWMVPLPDGPLPHVEDPFQVGLLPPFLLSTRKVEVTDTMRYKREGEGSVSVSVTRTYRVDNRMDGEEDEVENAIMETLPNREGVRHHCIFQLVRRLRAMPRLADADPEGLDWIILRWYDLAKHVIRTKDFKVSRRDFIDGWREMLFHIGHGPIDALWAEALQTPYTPEEDYDRAEIQRLATFCRVLQSRAGSRPFFLDCRTAGRLLDVRFQRAAEWLKRLKDDGVIIVEKKWSRTEHRANEYRYIARSKAA